MVLNTCWTLAEDDDEGAVFEVFSELIATYVEFCASQ